MSKIAKVSKVIALIAFGLIPVGSFYLGAKYQALKPSRTPDVITVALSKNQPPVEAPPYIKLVSPMGGSTLCLGTQQIISWDYHDMKSVNIYVGSLAGQSIIHLADNLPADNDKTTSTNKGELLWAVGKNLDGGNLAAGGSDPLGYYQEGYYQITIQGIPLSSTTTAYQAVTSPPLYFSLCEG